MSRADRWLGPGVFAVAGAFLAWTALPGAHWHDSGEFGAVAARLSLSHPPGHPLHALTTHAALSLPLGDAGFRANLASALALAAALAVLARVLRRLAPDAPVVAAGCAALLPAVMPAVWMQGARAEVYALQLLLGAGTAALCLQPRDGRTPAALALTIGLAGANHSLVAATWMPLALAVLCVRPRLRSLAWTVPAGALGLAAYAYLPIRARAGAEVGWGTPDTPQALWTMISAREWQRGVVPDTKQLDVVDNLSSLTAYGIDQLGTPVSLVLLGVILIGTPRLVRDRRWAALGVAGVVASAFATRVIYAVDLLNPDLGGYVAAGLVGGMALAWTACGALPRPVAWVFPALLPLAAPRFDPGERRDARTAEPYARALLGETPAGGALITSDYASWFLTVHLRALEGTRPDVALVFRGQVGRDWFQARLAAHRPEVATRVAGFPETFGEAGDRFEPGVEMRRLGALASALRPVGLTWAVAGEAPLSTIAAAFSAVGEPGDLDGRRARAFLHLQHAEQALGLGHGGALARWHLDRASDLAPGDPEIAALRARAPP